ncbi:hypothetical protein [Kutzneria kofuensis]|uniref:DUF8017 domain-containing protein n=1 Tax=Kutzneria kofuensis TaxID=103725 RepID=A0A7W9KFD5_9PSEU|nr:hypothetical protein [Kutzneria kofuensis]MBB5890824.1 hypothetical protein [Kutzneria kofuensis]
MTWPSGGSGYGDNQAGGPDSSGPQGVPGYQQQQPYGQQAQYPGYTYGQPQYPGYPQQPPQYQQPYQSNYGGFGMYQQPPQGPPPRNRRTLTIVLSLVGVLVLAGVVTTVVLLTRNGQPQAGERTQQASAPPTTSASRKPLDPRVQGWQVAVSNRRNVAYDIPKSQWTKDDPDAIAGMGPSDGDFVTGTGAAYYMKGYCAGQSGSVRAGTAVTASDNQGPDQSSPDTAKHWATVAYKADSGQAPDVKMEPSKQIKIADGKITATLSVADVTTPQSTNPCTPPSAKVYAAAVKTSDTGSVILVLFADQGVPNALSDDDAMKIMATMRPSG